MPTKDHKEQPEVTIMGEKISESSRCQEDPGNIVWGVLFLLTGIVLLFNFMGSVPWEVWDHIWPFWPVLLILAGIQIILGNNIISRLLLFLLSISLFGFIIVLALKQIGSPYFNYLPPEVLNLVETWEEIRR